MGKVMLVQVDPETSQGLQLQASRRIPVEFEEISDPDTAIEQAEAQLSEVDSLVIGTHVPEPLRIAQRAQVLDRDLAVLVLCDKNRHPQLSHAVQFSPFIGAAVGCYPVEEVDELADVLVEGVMRTQQRRKYHATLHAAQKSLSAATTPLPHNIYLEQLLRHLPIGVAAVDVVGTVLAWNPRATQILGISERTAVGESLPGLFVEPESLQLEKMIGNCLRLGRECRSETLKFRSRYLEITVNRVEDRNPIPRAIVLIQDVTSKVQQEQELKRLTEQAAHAAQNARRAEEEVRRVNRRLAAAHDQAIQASHAKSLFLANMSHELRTPLNAIIGYAEMMEEEAKEMGDDQLVRDVSRISGAGRHLLAIVSDILDLSKIEAGRMELTIEDFEIQTLLDDVLQQTEPLARKNRNHFCLEAPPDVGSMNSDPVKLRQTLLNLLSNACKFTEEGVVRLRVWRELQGERAFVVFEVSDTGIGIAPEDMEKLFIEFSQADSSYTRKHGGTGLGLALSRRFCEMMGGEISARSEVGKGSVFTVKLPAEIPSEE